MTTPHRSPAYQRTRRAWLKALRNGQLDPTCFRCGYPVDVTLPGNHPEGPSMEHTVAISEGGDIDANLDDLAVSHLRCNREHGGRLGANKTNTKQRREGPKSTSTAARPIITASQPRKRDESDILRQSADTPAPPSAIPPRKAQEGPRTVENELGTFVYPRLETKRHKACKGSHGGSAREWLADVFGMQLRPWQAYALDRALEFDADGKLIWQTVIVTVARQSGKSWLARGLAMWRLHHPEIFGEEQTLLHVANRTNTAMEVMRPAGLWVEEKYGKGLYKRGNQAPGIALPNGCRWLVHAANESAGVGYSVSMAFVDEAWAIRRSEVIEGAIAPTMAEREQPQLWLVSTAGDSESELLDRYRQRAISQLDDESSGNILLLEWSAPPDADPDDEKTWKWASPEWSEKRAAFLRSQWSAIDLTEWRSNYLNQWVSRADHWLRDEEWEATKRPNVPLPPDKPWVVAVESEFDLSGHAVAIAAVNDDGLVVVRVTVHRDAKQVDERIAELRREHPDLSLFVTPHFRDRIADRSYSLVGRTEAAQYTPYLLMLIQQGQLSHDGNQTLLEHLHRSVISKTDKGHALVAPGGTLGVYAARAVLFAAGEATKRPAPKPAVYSRRR